METAHEHWARFFSLCLLRRTSSSEFLTLSQQLSRQSPLHGSKLTESLFAQKAGVVDPLLTVYADLLLSQNLVDLADILRSLLRASPFHHKSAQTEEDANAAGNGQGQANAHARKTNLSDLEEVMIYLVIRTLTTGQRPRSDKECFGTIKAVSRWMEAVVTTGTREEMMRGMAGDGPDALVGADQESVSIAIKEVVGMLAVSVAEAPKIAKALNSKACPKELRQGFIRSLSLYIPFLSPTSMQIANRLETFEKQYNIQGNKSEKGNNHEANGTTVGVLPFNGLDGTMDGPPIHSRAGLYVWLNASFVGRPLVDDMSLLNYLNARYKGDISSTAIDLVTASFDVLANTMYRSEPLETITLIRSYLVNKVPLFLASLSGSLYPPLTPEFCISQAFTHIDSNAFPSLSQMFDLNSGSGQLSEARSEFLFACALHNIIPEESIERLLGEIPMQTLPTGGRYIKDNLVSQFSNNPERVEELIGEMEGMDGNAGAIAMAIGTAMQSFSSAKATMSLKTICSSLLRRQTAIDVMLLFNTPNSILQPICYLLNEWHYEEDQGECQPVYDEFGCILLFVMVMIHRHDLSLSDLGVTSKESFVARLLEKGSRSQHLQDLSEEQNKHLGGWIRSLFEAEGISDELMSSCRPQDFYLLVSTFFSQSAAAYSVGTIDLETLKDGLQFFFETFLLTSLLPALNCLKTSLWEAQSQAQTSLISSILQIIHILLTPPSISGDAQAMHTAIISIAAKSIESTIRCLRHTSPILAQDGNTEPILQALSQHTHQPRRHTHASIAELESWATQHASSSSPGGLLGSLRSTFQSLVLWSATASANSATDMGMQMSMPLTTPPYTHRQMLAAQALVGAPYVIRALIDEIKLQISGSSANDVTGMSGGGDNGEMALDLASSMICAPVAATARELPSKFGQAKCQMSLREALKLELDELMANPKLAAANQLRAEATGRLYRRVEALIQSIQAAHNASAAAVGAAGMGVPDLAASVNVDMDVDVSGLGGSDLMQTDPLSSMGGDLGGEHVQSGESGEQQKISHSGDQDIDDILGAAAVGVEWDTYGDTGLDFDFN